jgi:hypothetical protein
MMANSPIAHACSEDKSNRKTCEVAGAATAEDDRNKIIAAACLRFTAVAAATPAPERKSRKTVAVSSDVFSFLTSLVLKEKG